AAPDALLVAQRRLAQRPRERRQAGAHPDLVQDSERIAQLIELDRSLDVVQQDFRVTEEDPGYLLLDELRVDGRIDEVPDVVAGVGAVPVLDWAVTRVKAGHHGCHPA